MPIHVRRGYSEQASELTRPYESKGRLSVAAQQLDRAASYGFYVLSA